MQRQPQSLHVQLRRTRAMQIQRRLNLKATAPEQAAENQPLLQLEPPTPDKKAKTEEYKAKSVYQKTCQAGQLRIEPWKSKQNMSNLANQEKNQLSSRYPKKTLHPCKSFGVCNLHCILCSLWQQRFSSVSLSMHP